MNIEDRYRKAFPEHYENEPTKTKWRYIPLVIVAIAILLMALPAFATPRLISNTVLCDDKEQLVDILEASGKTGQFEDTRNRLFYYGSIKNKYNEPVCAFLQNPIPYEIHNEFKIVRTFSPGQQEYQDIYVVKVSYPQYDGPAIGYIALSKEALNQLIGEPEVEKKDL